MKFVASKIDFLLKQSNKFGLIDPTPVAVWYKEYTTIPHSNKLKNLD